jgi:Domain of unknown function (DUF2828)
MINSTTATSISLIDALRTSDALTANGAVTNSTSLNACLDLFFVAGACREMSEDEIGEMISNSWACDKLTTLKIIFYSGDVRGGQGQRRFFRIAMSWLEANAKDTLIKLIQEGRIEEFTRWDNMFHLTQDEAVKAAMLARIKVGLENEDGLLAKWLPRKIQYNNLKASIKAQLRWSDEQYRKAIVKLSSTVEQQMSASKFDEINFSAVPSQAFKRYLKAFKKRDETRFAQFIEDVESGKEKINAGVIFPYQLYQALKDADSEDDKAINAQWGCLPNYMEESEERILPLCDVSGSMDGLPMDTSISLGIYISERNHGIFKDAFITFHENPTLQYLQGNFAQKARAMIRTPWGGNTDFQKVFDLLLQKALDHNLPEKELPTTLLVISDMEFDRAEGYGSSKTNFEVIKEKYKNSGYQLPKLLFWNVNGRAGNVPITFNQEGTGLVSGHSPSIIKSVLCPEFTPLNIMMKTIEVERYSQLTV